MQCEKQTELDKNLDKDMIFTSSETLGECRLSKNYWGQVIRKQSPNSRRKANHSH